MLKTASSDRGSNSPVKLRRTYEMLAMTSRPGSGMKQIETLLALWSAQDRASSEVKKRAQAHASELGRKILDAGHAAHVDRPVEALSRQPAT